MGQGRKQKKVGWWYGTVCDSYSTCQFIQRETKKKGEIKYKKRMSKIIQFLTILGPFCRQSLLDSYFELAFERLMNDRRARTQCLALRGYGPITVAYYRDKGGAMMRAQPLCLSIPDETTQNGAASTYIPSPSPDCPCDCNGGGACVGCCCCCCDE